MYEPGESLPGSLQGREKCLEKEGFEVFAMTRLRLPVALIIAAALAALLALAAFSSNAEASHSWGNYHWARQSNPFTLQLGDNVTSAWDRYLQTTSTDWSKSSVLDTTIAAGLANPKNCRPTSGRVEACNNRYGNNGWLGLAQIWASGSHIVQGTTKMNDTYFNTAKYNTPAWRNMVMCQEVGHTFGLDHQDEVFDNVNLGSCMDYTNDPSGKAGTNGTLSNEHPNQHDYDQLVTIYAHLDSTTTVSSTSAVSKMPPAASRGSFNSRAEWGRKIRESRNGKLELWVRDFGGGAKLFTWVIRA
jgi:hypothetical protein